MLVWLSQIIPDQHLCVTALETNEKLVLFGDYDLEHLPVEVKCSLYDLLVRLVLAVIEAPNLENILLADREEGTSLSNLVDLHHGFSVDREPGEDVRQIIDFHEDDSSFGETNNKELIEDYAVLVLDEFVIGLCWLRVLVEILRDLTIVLRWLGRAVTDAGDRLVHALALVVLE